MRTFFRFFLLTLCSLVLTATSAMAFGEIRYPDRPLNLRANRSPKAAWVGSLYPGQKVRVAYLQDGWVAIFEPDETRNSESAAVGYSNAKYLIAKPSRVEPESWGELVFTPRKLNIRSGPSAATKQLDMLEANERVKIDFPDGDWVMVFSPKATIRSNLNGRGFCSGKYFVPVSEKSVAQSGEVKPSPIVSEVVEVDDGTGQVGGAVAAPPSAESSSPAAEPEKTADSNSWGTIVTVGRKVNLRQERTSSSGYVRTLQPGERVRVDFLKNGWYAVFHENEVIHKEKRAIGYALKSLIDEGNAETSVSMSEESQSVAAPSVQEEPQVIVKTPAQTPAQATEPAVAQVPEPQAAPEQVSGKQQTMVIDRSKITSSKRPDPTPDKNAHGYQYKLLEKSETKQYGETWITLKVFLATKILPGTDALRDFSTTLWREHLRASKNLVVLIYLPGMDTEDLAYGVIKFTDKEMIELWVRKATLFGTDFM